mmetsp:Transcript_40717/g.101799  ORF Transcript_40717/g.101799 Transcript_40717/m.101799 type:complete len:273 (+) Transcript_40717:940-1758(+)
MCLHRVGRSSPKVDVAIRPDFPGRLAAVPHKRPPLPAAAAAAPAHPRAAAATPPLYPGTGKHPAQTQTPTTDNRPASAGVAGAFRRPPLPHPTWTKTPTQTTPQQQQPPQTLGPKISPPVRPQETPAPSPLQMEKHRYGILARSRSEDLVSKAAMYGHAPAHAMPAGDRAAWAAAEHKAWQPPPMAHHPHRRAFTPPPKAAAMAAAAAASAAPAAAAVAAPAVAAPSVGRVVVRGGAPAGVERQNSFWGYGGVRAARGIRPGARQHTDFGLI